LLVFASAALREKTTLARKTTEDVVGSENAVTMRFPHEASRMLAIRFALP
jgi:hypothetical protein